MARNITTTAKKELISKEQLIQEKALEEQMNVMREMLKNKYMSQWKKSLIENAISQNRLLNEMEKFLLAVAEPKSAISVHSDGIDYRVHIDIAIPEGIMHHEAIDKQEIIEEILRRTMLSQIENILGQIALTRLQRLQTPTAPGIGIDSYPFVQSYPDYQTVSGQYKARMNNFGGMEAQWQSALSNAYQKNMNEIYSQLTGLPPITKSSDDKECGDKK